MELEKIKTQIGKENVLQMMIILSLLQFDKSQTKNLQNIYLEEINRLHDEKICKIIEKEISRNILCSEQGILTAWKYLIANRNERLYKERSLAKTDVYNTVNLILALQDHLHNPKFLSQEKLESYLIKNIIFNSNKDDRLEIVRPYLMYISSEVKRTKASIEFDKVLSNFKKTYQYSLDDYLLIIFVFFLRYSFEYQTISLETPWILSIKSTQLGEIANQLLVKIANELVANKEMLKTWSEESCELNWDFRMFYEKPLFDIGDYRVIPFNKKYLLSQFYDSLLFKMQSCTDKKCDFNALNGYILEDYCTWLVKSLGGENIKKYKIIEEFKYKKNQRKSPVHIPDHFEPPFR
ncbi:MULTISPECIES: hypothetical protein [unclassified Fusibacter]|uniref:hypothetical protein n=1 Tax=unclassified Fusibacter TaxID=2624464 RepID=UPI001011B84C|nr:MULTISPECIES: hypothetical protein [unclassified Fusibacter]MCK8061632.1 hypothetical protein [Fusibacter sp. A2]NPE23816.1 hypothetical protein [Fusibacter sp. A1]RXV58654.1 hypothetical protein DWB64_18695 [Fusibacter sp. A1]